jgi:pilus assembly protein Flp/PilA
MKVIAAFRTSRRRLLSGEAAATSIEYALLGSLIAAVIAATVGMLGSQVLDLFQSAADLFP